MGIVQISRFLSIYDVAKQYSYRSSPQAFATPLFCVLSFSVFFSTTDLDDTDVQNKQVQHRLVKKNQASEVEKPFKCTGVFRQSLRRERRKLD